MDDDFSRISIENESDPPRSPQLYDWLMFMEPDLQRVQIELGIAPEDLPWRATASIAVLDGMRASGALLETKAEIYQSRFAHGTDWWPRTIQTIFEAYRARHALFTYPAGHPWQHWDQVAVDPDSSVQEILWFWTVDKSPEQDKAAWIALFLHEMGAVGGQFTDPANGLIRYPDRELFESTRLPTATLKPSRVLFQLLKIEALSKMRGGKNYQPYAVIAPQVITALEQLNPAGVCASAERFGGLVREGIAPDQIQTELMGRVIGQARHLATPLRPRRG